MQTLHFSVWTKEAPAAHMLVQKFHYSKRIPKSIKCIGTWHLPGGLFGDMGECIAACFFGWPAARWTETVLELSRLVRNDAYRPPLTGLIGLTVAFIRRERICDLLISYADPSQKHHGGIYQAASWNYHGLRSPDWEGVTVNGRFLPGRQANHLWGTRSPKRIREILGPNHTVELVIDEGKHLYWRALNKAGLAKARRLGLSYSPYPKPQSNAMAEERKRERGPRKIVQYP